MYARSPMLLGTMPVEFVGAANASNNNTIGVHANSINGDFARFWGHSTAALVLSPPSSPALSGVETINLSTRRMASGGRIITGNSDTCVFTTDTGTAVKVNGATYRNVHTGITHKDSDSSSSASTISLAAITDAAPGSMFQIDISFNQQDAAVDTTDFPLFTSWNGEASASAIWRHFGMLLTDGVFPGGDINFTVGGNPHADIFTASWVVIR